MKNEIESKFELWMTKADTKKPNTAYSYARSIEKISRHFSEASNTKVDLFHITDLTIIKKIAAEYAIGGRYAEFGEKGRGTIRNAIQAFIRYLEAERPENESFISNVAEDTQIENIEISEDDQLTLSNAGFTYEKDLQGALIWQAESLFPGFRIFGDNQEGIEYSIDGKRIDLLLENDKENALIAVELKAGEADFRVFGQISMYLGLLSQKFPSKSISGVIIAGKINDSLKYACITNEKVKIKEYRMQIILEDV